MKAQSRSLVPKRYKTTLWSSRFLLKVCINTYASWSIQILANACICDRQCAPMIHIHMIVCKMTSGKKWNGSERAPRRCIFIKSRGEFDFASSTRPTQFLHEEEIATPRIYIHARTCIAGIINVMQSTALIVPRHERCMMKREKQHGEHVHDMRDILPCFAGKNIPLVDRSYCFVVPLFSHHQWWHVMSNRKNQYFWSERGYFLRAQPICKRDRIFSTVYSQVSVACLFITYPH